MKTLMSQIIRLQTTGGVDARYSQQYGIYSTDWCQSPIPQPTIIDNNRTGSREYTIQAWGIQLFFCFAAFGKKVGNI